MTLSFFNIKYPLNKSLQPSPFLAFFCSVVQIRPSFFFQILTKEKNIYDFFHIYSFHHI